MLPKNHLSTRRKGFEACSIGLDRKLLIPRVTGSWSEKCVLVLSLPDVFPQHFLTVLNNSSPYIHEQLPRSSIQHPRLPRFVPSSAMVPSTMSRSQFVFHDCPYPTTIICPISYRASCGSRSFAGYPSRQTSS